MTEQATEKPSRARKHMLRTRVSEAGVEAIDGLRFGWSRSEYVRQALAAAIRSRMSGPRENDL